MNLQNKSYIELNDFEKRVLIEVTENALNSLNSGSYQSFFNVKTTEKFCIYLLMVLRNG